MKRFFAIVIAISTLMSGCSTAGRGGYEPIPGVSVDLVAAVELYVGQVKQSLHVPNEETYSYWCNVSVSFNESAMITNATVVTCSSESVASSVMKAISLNMKLPDIVTKLNKRNVTFVFMP